MKTLGLILAAAAALAAQEPREAQVQVAGATVRYLHSAAAPESRRQPLVVVMSAVDPKEALPQWTRNFPAGWLLVFPYAPGLQDGGVKAIEAVILDARRRLPADPARVYLAGGGPTTSDVFYTLARIPDLFAAAVAVQGTPAAAVNTNKLFAAGTSMAPLLWVAPPAFAEKVQAKLKAAGYRYEAAEAMTSAQVIEWLLRHRRPATPYQIDCETPSPSFARCHWVEIVKFNPRRRNDAIPPTRVRPGSGASLAIGGFGYDPSGPGPGVEVVWLPDGYSGPLRLKDRILAVGGVEIKDSRAYADYMDELTEAKLTAVTVQRGEERLRLETAIKLPTLETAVTARVQGTWLPDTRELLLITRAVSELRLQLPKDWAPAKALWNGNELALSQEGCWLLTEKEGQFDAKPCPAP